MTPVERIQCHSPMDRFEKGALRCDISDVQDFHLRLNASESRFPVKNALFVLLSIGLLQKIVILQSMAITKVTI